MKMITIYLGLALLIPSTYAVASHSTRASKAALIDALPACLWADSSQGYSPDRSPLWRDWNIARISAASSVTIVENSKGVSAVAYGKPMRLIDGKVYRDVTELSGRRNRFTLIQSYQEVLVDTNASRDVTNAVIVRQWIPTGPAEGCSSTN